MILKEKFFFFSLLTLFLLACTSGKTSEKEKDISIYKKDIKSNNSDLKTDIETDAKQKEIFEISDSEIKQNGSEVEIESYTEEIFDHKKFDENEIFPDTTIEPVDLNGFVCPFEPLHESIKDVPPLDDVNSNSSTYMKKFTLKDFYGKVVVVFFTGLGCGECFELALSYDKKINELKEQGFLDLVFIVVNTINNEYAVFSYSQYSNSIVLQDKIDKKVVQKLGAGYDDLWIIGRYRRIYFKEKKPEIDKDDELYQKFLTQIKCAYSD